MRIAHIADIHIRLAARHNEYKQVFDELIADLYTKKPHRIILVGDIVHSKTSMSPEMFTTTYNLFVNLLHIADVDLIPGNHDLNISNTKRLDALTPVIEAIQAIDLPHKLTYMKATGFYDTIIDNKDVVYGVWSLIDGLPLSLNEKDKYPNKIYIALYHGAVSGSRVDTNYILSDSTISQDIFNNFDFVFMGDIHKHQFLGETELLEIEEEVSESEYNLLSNRDDILELEVIDEESTL